MRGSPLALQHALTRRLLPLAWALAVVAGLILALTWLALNAQISLAGFSYSVGPVFAGEHVEVVATDGIVSILHNGVLVASHAQRLRADP